MGIFRNGRTVQGMAILKDHDAVSEKGFSCSVRALQKMLARGCGGGQSDHKFQYLPIIIGFSVSFGGLGPPHFEDRKSVV